MKHIDLIDIFKRADSLIGKSVAVCGWSRTTRDSKTVAFIELNDGTTLKHIQIVIDKASFGECSQVLALGNALCVEGVLVENPNNFGGVEVNATKITVLGECPPDYPLQKKRHTLEYLRTIPHLRPRTNLFNAMLRVRSQLSYAIHNYFMARNFTYIHTPIITGSDCEGAGEVFRVTTHDWKTDFKSEEEYYQNDFFGKKAGLTVSGQLDGEVAAMAMGKIYTFGPTFRAENSNTTRHTAEFWQIEPEVAFCKLDGIIEIAEEMIKEIIASVLKNCPNEMDFFESFVEKGLKEKLNLVVNSEFVKLEYTKAIELLKQSGKKFEYPVEWGCDLQTEHERYIAEEVYGKPVFIINYPKKLKAFYMKQNDDGLTVAATDLLVPQIGEIIGCSEREDDYNKLLDAITVRNMKESDYNNYLALRTFGSCPHSGFGLGLERILMYITGIGNIRDVVLFSRTVNNLQE